MKHPLTIIIVLIAIALVLGFVLRVQYEDDPDQERERPGESLQEDARPDINGGESDEGVDIEDIEEGDGAEAVPGARITAHYHGTLEDGTVFDSSRDRGEPFVFTLGAGQVIQGWDIGIAGMREGGVRRLTVPPELAYGSAERGAIPANSTLIFEVELIEVSTD